MKGCLIFVLCLLCSIPAYANEVSITTLLEAAAKQPDIEASRLGIEASAIQLQQTHAELFPKISAFGSYTIFDSPTNLRPMPPTEVNIPGGESIPFSERITRYGLKLEMPLFVKKLYTLADKVKELQQASKASYQLRLITRQATVVSVNASLAFTAQVHAAMTARIESLTKTQQDLQLAVNNGRAPQSELQKIETLLNTLQQQQNDLLRQDATLRSQLTSLTNLQVKHAVPMALQRAVIEGDFLREREWSHRSARPKKI